MYGAGALAAACTYLVDVPFFILRPSSKNPMRRSPYPTPAAALPSRDGPGARLSRNSPWPRPDSGPLPLDRRLTRANTLSRGAAGSYFTSVKRSTTANVRRGQSGLTVPELTAPRRPQAPD